MKRTLLLSIMAFLCAIIYGQDTPVKKNYEAVFTDTPPLIDGSTDDEAWQKGHWTGEFSQFEPYNGNTASQKTEFKILCDDNNIYVAIKAYDNSPDSIIRRIARRDNADGDYVGIAFDSYHDLRTGFLFIVNAAGVKGDQIMSGDGQNEDSTWDPIWYSGTKIYDWGWSAEMKIPLTQLRFKIAEGGIWGLEVFRQIARNQELSFWQHIERNASGLIHNFGEVTGFASLKPRKQADITPFAVTSVENYEKTEGNPFATGRDYKFNGGIDGKFGVTNDMTLDLTINPDFGQVEADPSEVNLTAYETFFKEKRPFFIEGKNITSFGTGIGDGDLGNDNLFYSRRIGRAPQHEADVEDNEYVNSPRTSSIIGAIKLTGKTADGLSLGIIEALTSEEKATIDSLGERSVQTIEPMTSYFVARVIKDFNSGNTIVGGAYTNTSRFLSNTGINDLVKNANTAGFDFTQYFKEKNWTFSANVAVSNLNGSTEAISDLQTAPVHYYQRPDADYVNYDPERTSLNGTGGNIQFGKVGGDWNFMLFGIWKTPGFDLNDVGYLQSADDFTAVAWSGYSFNKPFSIFRRININFNQWNSWDFGGNHLQTGGNINGYTQFTNLWSLNFGANLNGNGISNGALRGGPSMKTMGNISYFAGISSNESAKLSFELFLNANRGFENHSNALHLEGGVTFKPGKSISLTASPSLSTRYSETQFVSKAYSGDERVYILGTLEQKIAMMSLRLNYNITPELTIQYWGQPFFASMNYKDYKVVTSPHAESFEDRFHIFGNSEISYNSVDDCFDIDENNNGETDYSFDDPEANVDVFLSNLVVRWEFNPGSTVYLVWSQTRDYYDGDGKFALGNNINNLFSENKPYDVFLVKFTYRFGLR